MKAYLRLVPALWIALAAVPVTAQGRVLSGRTVEVATGEPLAGAALASGASRSLSSADGRFTVVADGPTLIVARLGFAPETLTVSALPDTVEVRMRPAPLRLSPTLVRADQALTAVSSGTVRAFDLQVRPRASSQELLRLVPGLVIAQHAGGGKAEQIFLRGFDADHGTDVAITVDGMPVNLVSHGHGQGYADLHFLIPEVVERLDVRKGPYDVRDGDLGVAGSVGFVTRDRVAATSASLGAGSFGQRIGTLLVPFGGDASRAGGYLAGQGTRADGPFELAQGLSRSNVFAKYTAPVRDARLSVSASAFRSAWDASGQVPERAVMRGLISRFGAIDSSEGGNTARANVVASLAGGSPLGTSWEARAYAARYTFQLFSNFTFFADDTASGDGIEQVDRRTFGGFEVSATRLQSFLGTKGTWRAATGTRIDGADVGLYSAVARARGTVRTSDRVRVTNPFALLERNIVVGGGLRASLGLRADGFRFASTDLTRGGVRQHRTDAVVSPKASLAWDINDQTTVFANAGRGFHSNDARAVVAGGGTSRAVPVAHGAELGARHSGRLGSVAVAAWGLDLQSELVWSGDAGTTEASGRTRRVGVDVEGRASLGPWLTADVDVSVSRGRLRDEPRGQDRIPLAPTLTSTGGLTATPGRWVAALRWRQVGPRAATEDNTVRALGYTLLDLSAKRTIGDLTLQVAVDNLTNRAWNEAQFATTSRLRGEAAPVTELHFTPGAPRAVVISATRAFGR